MEEINSNIRDLFEKLKCQFPIPPLQKFIDIDKHKLNFKDKLSLLFKLLQEYRSQNKREDELKNIYLSLCWYFSGQNCKARDIFAEISNVDKSLIDIFLVVKYTIGCYDKIVLVPSFNQEESFTKDAYQILGFNNKLKKITASYFWSKESFFKIISNYDQLILTGHGNEGVIKFRDNDPLTPDNFIQAKIQYGDNFPKIIMILACGDFLGTSKDLFLQQFDVVITDTFQSVPEFSEAFISGYCNNYFKTSNLFFSVDQGLLALIFQATNIKSISYYLNGKEVINRSK